MQSGSFFWAGDLVVNRNFYVVAPVRLYQWLREMSATSCMYVRITRTPGYCWLMSTLLLLIPSGAMIPLAIVRS